MMRSSARSGTLYLVATPIGNLKDISFRAVDILKSVSWIACEDSRRAKILLTAYDIHRPLIGLHQAREREQSERVLGLLRRGEDVALISEAGTPSIQDPGFVLVRQCRRLGISVLALPGPCAAITALSVSGLPTNAFVFEGFLSFKSASRQRAMRAWVDETRTIIFYESPHRLVRCLEDLRQVFGNVRVVLARELTKKFEEVREAPLDEWLDSFKSARPLGEFVVLLNLQSKSQKDDSGDTPKDPLS